MAFFFRLQEIDRQDSFSPPLLSVLSPRPVTSECSRRRAEHPRFELTRLREQVRNLSGPKTTHPRTHSHSHPINPRRNIRGVRPQDFEKKNVLQTSGVSIWSTKSRCGRIFVAVTVTAAADAAAAAVVAATAAAAPPPAAGGCGGSGVVAVPAKLLAGVLPLLRGSIVVADDDAGGMVSCKWDELSMKVNPSKVSSFEVELCPS